MPPSERGRARLEAAAAFLAVLSALAYFATFVRTMATTSLWNDEIFSILYFSGEGPLTTLTSYPVPNNHIFFNLLSSLLPGRGSFDPLDARFLSILAVTVFLMLGLGFFWRQRRWFAGALFVQLFAVGWSFLDLTLQARGYGFLALMSLLVCLVARRALRAPGRAHVVWLSLLTVLGTWTGPTFVFWSGPLLLLLLVKTGRREVFWAGFVALAGILLVYLPVLEQLVLQIGTFENDWGRQYATVGSVVETLREFAIPATLFGGPLKDWAVFAVFAGLVFAAASLRGEGEKEERSWIRLLIAASIVFFVLCLAIETPLVRTTSFVAVPLALALVEVVDAGLRRVRPGLRAPVLALSAISLVMVNLEAAATFRFTPIENWLEVGRFIDRTFPARFPYHADLAPEFLRGHLGPWHPSEPSPSREELEGGSLLWLENSYVPGQRFAPGPLAGKLAAFRVPQRRAGYQAIWFAPPPESGVASVTTADGQRAGPELFDRNLATAWQPARARGSLSLEIELKPGGRYRSVVLVGDPWRRGEVTARGLEDGTWTLLRRDAVRRHEGLLVIDLGGRFVRRVRLEMPTPPRIAEVWAYTVD